MSGQRRGVLDPPFARFAYGADNPTLSATVALGLVADTAEPVAAEAGRPIPEPDRDDLDSVGHA